MTPFIIVADLRTGSTLLSTSLNRHPRVRCYGELFHPDEFPDNVPPGCDRYRSTARELIAAALAEHAAAAGFRSMIFLPMPSEPRWRGAWRVLRNLDGLRVVYLTRRDALAQYASIAIAQRARAWHPSPGDPILDPENRPQITIDPREFRRWRRQRERLFARRRQQLAGKPALELDYETLTADWPRTIRRVQEFVGVDPLRLEPAKQKQERRPLAEVITNYDQLAGTINRMPPDGARSSGSARSLSPRRSDR